MKESLDRIERAPNKSEDTGVLQHLEATSGEESTQPISTLYPEATPSGDVVAKTITKAFQGNPDSIPDPANDTKRIVEVKKNLRQNVEVVEDSTETLEEIPEELEDVPAVEVVAESVEADTSVSETEGSTDSVPAEETAGKDGDGGGGKPKKTGHSPSSKPGGEKKKGPVSRFLGGFFGVFLWLGAVTVWSVTTAVRKVTERLMKTQGWKDDGKGGGGGGGAAAKKPAAPH